MSTEIKVWEIEGGKLLPIQSKFSAHHLESHLEKWLCHSPDILGEKLLILARQPRVPGVGVPDLLCMDASGRMVVVELKRGRTPRDVVTQALDYASWLSNASNDEIKAEAEAYLGAALEDKFREYFHVELGEWSTERPRVLLVAPILDSCAERIVNFLAERYGVEINAVFFNYSRLNGGKEILTRSVLVPESVTPAGKKNPSEAELISMAAENKTEELVSICRQMGAKWHESRGYTGGGSFRYWANKPDGGGTMIFGINAAGALGKERPPLGQLDVWVHPDSLAEVTGIAEKTIRSRIGKIATPFKASVMHFVLRLKTPAKARQLVKQLKALSA